MEPRPPQAAVDRGQATPIIIGTKDFPEQYVLGQLYKQALEAKGFKVQYKENIGSTELIDKSLRSGKVTFYPEYTGIMLSVTFGKKTLPKTAIGTYNLAKQLYGKRGSDAAEADAVPGPRRDRGAADDRVQVRRQDGRRPEEDPEPDARGLPAVRDAVGTEPAAPLRRQVRLHAAGGDQRLHAAEPEQGARGGDLQHRPAADLDQVRRAAASRGTCSASRTSRPVLNKKLVSENGSSFTSTVNKVSALLSTRAMIAMNKAVAIDKKPAAAVAKAFLKANKLS